MLMIWNTVYDVLGDEDRLSASDSIRASSLRNGSKLRPVKGSSPCDSQISKYCAGFSGSNKEADYESGSWTILDLARSRNGRLTAGPIVRLE